MAPALHSYFFCSATKCRHVVQPNGTFPEAGVPLDTILPQAVPLPCSPCAMAAVATKNTSITTIKVATLNNTRMRCFFMRYPPPSRAGDQPRLKLINVA
jgi:hypothetical protein